MGDRLGRSRALMLTILTYASFTGLSYFAQTWWQLLIFRFLAALGIGGEWAVGAALLSETWPRHWRPWMAAVLQTGVNLGTMLASAGRCSCLAGLPHRTVFLVGVLPALLVLWIRRAVPEPSRMARRQGRLQASGAERDRRSVSRQRARSDAADDLGLFAVADRPLGISVLVLAAIAAAAGPGRLWSDAEKSQFVSQAMSLVMVSSIVGNFVAAAIARRIGYRLAIAV